MSGRSRRMKMSELEVFAAKLSLVAENLEGAIRFQKHPTALDYEDAAEEAFRAAILYFADVRGLIQEEPPA